MRNRSPADSSDTPITPPSGVNLNAFERRFNSTRCVFSASSSASSRAGMRSANCRWRSAASASKCDATKRSNCATSTSRYCGASAPASSFETSRRSLTCFSSSFALRSTTPRSRTADGDWVGSASRLRTGPRISVSGVRSSWLTLAKNCVFRASSSRVCSYSRATSACASRSRWFASASCRARWKTSASFCSASPSSSVRCCLSRTNSLTSSTRWIRKAIEPSAASTGLLTGLQKRSSNPPPSSGGRRMSYFCTGIASARRSPTARSSEARRLRAPLAAGSPGLSGNTSNRPRPRMASREVIVACR